MNPEVRSHVEAMIEDAKLRAKGYGYESTDALMLRSLIECADSAAARIEKLEGALREIEAWVGGCIGAPNPHEIASEALQ